jgi:hypothetical protein
VNNVWAEAYEVASTGENEWRISFDWGDKIDVGKIVIKDGNSFAITPIHQFISGDPGNYSIDTVDQEGTMVDPAYEVPDGLFRSMMMKEAEATGHIGTAADDEGTPADPAVSEPTQKEEVLTEEEAPAEEEVPAEEEAPTEEDWPAEEEAPAEEEVPTEEEVQKEEPKEEEPQQASLEETDTIG